MAEWEATAHSNLLDTDIALRLDGDQPRSLVASESFDTDFPARLEFRLNWGVEAAGRRITELDSTAVGTINSFPRQPNDRFEIQGKDVAIGDIRIESLVCAC